MKNLVWYLDSCRSPSWLEIRGQNKLLVKIQETEELCQDEGRNHVCFATDFNVILQSGIQWILKLNDALLWLQQECKQREGWGEWECNRVKTNMHQVHITGKTKYEVLGVPWKKNNHNVYIILILAISSYSYCIFGTESLTYFKASMQQLWSVFPSISL